MIRFLLAGCILFLLAGGAVVYFSVKAYLKAGSPVRTVEKHLESINRGNYQLAYSDFAERFQQKTSRADFQKMLRPYLQTLPSRKSDFHRIQVVNETAEVDGTLIGRNWAIVPFHYELQKQNGKWRIVHFEWSPPGKQLRT